MSLTNKYTVAASRIPDLFEKIRDGQAPAQLTQQLLKDWGFSSSNDRAFIPILKELDFLSPDGKPTTKYHEYRDHSRSKGVMATALRQAYGDLFLIKENPTESDKSAIKGKFKSFHNVSDHVAGLMTRTFYELLKIADLKSTQKKTKPQDKKGTSPKTPPPPRTTTDAEANNNFNSVQPPLSSPGLHYNIQIHLPPTKDIEVYNAIFKSLKEHLIEK